MGFLLLRKKLTTARQQLLTVISWQGVGSYPALKKLFTLASRQMVVISLSSQRSLLLRG